MCLLWPPRIHFHRFDVAELFKVEKPTWFHSCAWWTTCSHHFKDVCRSECKVRTLNIFLNLQPLILFMEGVFSLMDRLCGITSLHSTFHCYWQGVPLFLWIQTAYLMQASHRKPVHFIHATVIYSITVSPTSPFIQLFPLLFRQTQSSHVSIPTASPVVSSSVLLSEVSSMSRSSPVLRSMLHSPLKPSSEDARSSLLSSVGSLGLLFACATLSLLLWPGDWWRPDLLGSPPASCLISPRGACRGTSGGSMGFSISTSTSSTLTCTAKTTETKLCHKITKTVAQK